MKSEMPEPVLAARGVSKRFKLYGRPWHRLLELVPGVRPRHEEFWALRQVSFQVDRGEVFGVLGPNGAGKSTLLRLLAGTSAPSAGEVHLRGRPAALLELGAGFHPEMTGRENLFMTARLMGVEAGEARRRLPEMASFAEIGGFLDQPVRTYSAGMVVRLGFAVAAGFEPDILILDEALAVGDAYFQRKTLQRIQRMQDAGCTIVLVTHDLRLIGRFCRRAMWLEQGQVRSLGPAPDVLRAYESEVRRSEERRLAEVASQPPPRAVAVAEHDGGGAGQETPMAGARWGDGPIRILNVEMAVPEQKPAWVFKLRDTVELSIHAALRRPVEAPVFSFQIHRLDGLYVSGTSTADNNVDHFPLGPCRDAVTVTFRFAPMHLHAGSYFLSVQAYTEADEPFWSSPSDYCFQTWEFRILSPHAAHGVAALPGSWHLSRQGEATANLPRGVSVDEPGHGQWLEGEWYAAESGAVPLRWMGRQASLFMARSRNDRILNLDLCLPWRAGPAQQLTVTLDGLAAGRFVIEPREQTSLALPVPDGCGEGMVEIGLEVASTWSPEEAGIDDDRQLGVAWRRASWEASEALYRRGEER